MKNSFGQSQNAFGPLEWGKTIPQQMEKLKAEVDALKKRVEQLEEKQEEKKQNDEEKRISAGANKETDT